MIEAIRTQKTPYSSSRTAIVTGKGLKEEVNQMRVASTIFSGMLK
jgi:hypothetical protein